MGRQVDAERTRGRVLETAAALLAAGGPESVSIRAVSAATGIQAPTIYRHFDNKQGLLDAVTEHGFATHVRSHATIHPHTDPVDDLRWGWDAHVAYALAHPHEYRLTYALPHPGSPHPTAVHAGELLGRRIHRVAEAGRLRVPEELAVQLVEAGGTGTALRLLSEPEERRDPALSEALREAVIRAITTEPLEDPRDDPDGRDDGPASAAVQLRASLHQVAAFTPAERGLLREWLDRIARGVTPRRARPRG